MMIEIDDVTVQRYRQRLRKDYPNDTDEELDDDIRSIVWQTIEYGASRINEQEAPVQLPLDAMKKFRRIYTAMMPGASPSLINQKVRETALLALHGAAAQLEHEMSQLANQMASDLSVRPPSTN